MLHWVFRAFFLLIIVGVVFGYVSSSSENGFAPSKAGQEAWPIVVVSGILMAVFVFLLDCLTPKQKLGALAGVFFGLLVGLLVSVVLAPVVDLVNNSWGNTLDKSTQEGRDALIAIKTMMGICVCFLTISIVMRTKDDVRFVVPYVEFAKQTKGARPLILDTSAIVDGRVCDLCQSKLFDAPVIVPRFVLNELQLIADSADKLKRNRGRRGLDILNNLQNTQDVDVLIDDTTFPEVEELHGVDQKLMAFTKLKDGRLATTDYNLSKVALVRNVDVVNVNDLANSLKVVALPGEGMQIKIIKPGEESDQGIGYLDDGTMVVVEGARHCIGQDISLNVTSSLQTSAGKMIFGKYEGPVQLSRSSSSGSRRRPNSRRPYNRSGYSKGNDGKA